MNVNSRRHGFTLIEVMVTVIIVGIIAAIAIPSYIDQVRKGRRADAFDAMVLVQQQQERYRSQNLLYADQFEKLKAPSLSSGGHYTLALSDVTGIGYTLKATPSAGGRQAGDTACAELKLVVQRGSNVRSSVNAKGVDSTTDCWPQ